MINCVFYNFIGLSIVEQSVLKLPNIIFNLFFSNSITVSCILKVYYSVHKDFPESSVGKNLPTMKETLVWLLGQEDLLAKG